MRSYPLQYPRSSNPLNPFPSIFLFYIESRIRLDIESGIRLASGRNSKGSAEYEKVRRTRASLPQATVEQNRRELVAFCQQCWLFTNFRRNKGEIGILPLRVRLLIDTAYGTAEHQPGHLRRELTSQKIKKYDAMCLKPGKRTGPYRCPN